MRSSVTIEVHAAQEGTHRYEAGSGSGGTAPLDYKIRELVMRPTIYCFVMASFLATTAAQASLYRIQFTGIGNGGSPQYNGSQITGHLIVDVAGAESVSPNGVYTSESGCEPLGQMSCHGGGTPVVLDWTINSIYGEVNSKSFSASDYGYSTYQHAVSGAQQQFGVASTSTQRQTSADGNSVIEVNGLYMSGSSSSSSFFYDSTDLFSSLDLSVVDPSTNYLYFEDLSIGCDVLTNCSVIGGHNGQGRLTSLQISSLSPASNDVPEPITLGLVALAFIGLVPASKCAKFRLEARKAQA